MRNKIADILGPRMAAAAMDADFQYHADEATSEIMRLIRQYPTGETVDRYDGMTSTATDRVNRYAMVPLPEEDE